MDHARSSGALLGRSKNGVTQLLVRFENIIAMAPTEGKDRNAAAVDSYQIEVETAALVRAVEDLLSLTRELKEAWLFGQLDTLGTSKMMVKTGEDAAAVGEMLGGLLKEGQQV